MKTKLIICLSQYLLIFFLALLITTGVSAQMNTVDDINRMNTSDRLEVFKSLSDEEKAEWMKKYPRMKSATDESGQTLEPTAPFPAEGEEITAEEEKEPEDELVQPPSNIEQILSGAFPEEISRELQQYGYDFFLNRDISFAPDTGIPVGNDYIIGPGDNFKIHLWGKFEDVYDVTVNREGGIIIPRVGTVNVNGLSYSEMKMHLYHRFKEYYTDFQISITMGELRTIGIFVVGEALVPGTYSVSSLSTLVTALFEVKGPSKNGSLRNIQLIRNSKVIKTLDLYQFFLRGDKSQDHRLEPGDTIFIPVIGPVAGVAGNVRRPAIYELRAGENINSVIQHAGGLLPTGNLQNVVVERIEGHQKRVIKSFSINPGSPADEKEMLTQLKDGDLVKIYPVHKEIRNVVSLEGHVKYPREYEFRPGMTLKDLIPSYDVLLPEPYLAQGEIMRSIPPDHHTEIVKFDLGRMLEGDPASDLELKELDRVIVYHKWEKESRPEVHIKGAVYSPGAFTLYEGMDIKDLIFQAGNLTDKAYMGQGTISRILISEGGTDSISLMFSPEKAMAGIMPDNMPLEPNDTVYIREIPQLMDAMSRTVDLEGEFNFPGEYTFQEGERISSIIKKAGGLTTDAYPYGAIFQRESVRKIQSERFRDYIDTLEEEIFTTTIKMAEISMDKDQAQIAAQELATKKQLLEKMKAASPTGRMVIDLDDLLSENGTEDDFQLRPGDRLIVSKRPDHVNVMGEVYNPTALLFQKGKSVGYYLNRVGGMNDQAHEKEIYLVKANGDVISKGQESFFGLLNWDGKNQRWKVARGFESQQLDPGDTIIVPRKLVKYPWLALTKTITEITYQIAVTAGVIIAAY